MKRLTAITMAVLLVISGMICLQYPDKVYAEETVQNADVWDGTSDKSWYDANNVKTEYTLTTAEQLAGLAELTGSWINFAGIKIKLGADIILNEGDSSTWTDTPPKNKWTPIGDGKGNGTGHSFRGVFDGQGHTISGMYIESTSNYQQGLFGSVVCTDATKAPSISNVSVVNSYIKNSGAQKVGMLVGQIYASVGNSKINISNVYVQGAIDSSYTGGRVGGICSWINLQHASTSSTMNFSNVVSDVDISTTVSDTAETYIGGIMAFDGIGTSHVATTYNFENCVNMGKLTALTTTSTDGVITGGFIGATSNVHLNVNITNCVNAGDLTGKLAAAAIGNIRVSKASNFKVSQFVNSGQVSHTTTSNKPAVICGNDKTNTNITKQVEQCYSVPLAAMAGVTSIEKTVLTGADALTTLTSNGFDATNWTMVSGIVPLPTTAATMCGLTFKTVSLTLDSSMQMNFKVLKNAVNGYKPSKVVFALNGDTKEVTEYTDDGNYYVFSLSGIAPYQMQDKVTATLYGTYDTINFSTLGSKLSISDYCYAILNSSDYSADTYATLRTLIVDLLNYGAESQKRAGKTENLVNAELTTDQQAMASVDRELVSVKQMDYETVDNPSVTWKSAGLNLTDKVVMRLKFSATDTTGLKVQFSDGNGHTVDVTEFTAVPNEEGYYYVYLSELNAYQMSDAIYATVLNAEGTDVSHTMCYSVESYAYDAQNIDAGNLGALVKAMMRYGNSAKAYQER